MCYQGVDFKKVNSKKTRNVLPRGRCLKGLTRKRQGMIIQLSKINDTLFQLIPRRQQFFNSKYLHLEKFSHRVKHIPRYNQGINTRNRHSFAYCIFTRNYGQTLRCSDRACLYSSQKMLD